MHRLLILIFCIAAGFIFWLLLSDTLDAGAPHEHCIAAGGKPVIGYRGEALCIKPSALVEDSK